MSCSTTCTSSPGDVLVSTRVSHSVAEPIQRNPVPLVRRSDQIVGFVQDQKLARIDIPGHLEFQAGVDSALVKDARFGESHRAAARRRVVEDAQGRGWRAHAGSLEKLLAPALFDAAVRDQALQPNTVAERSILQLRGRGSCDAACTREFGVRGNEELPVRVVPTKHLLDQVVDVHFFRQDNDLRAAATVVDRQQLDLGPRLPTPRSVIHEKPRTVPRFKHVLHDLLVGE
mmetsp:Transcript_24691/g.62047  ORF Transcript_24691/g.62047 Transcript_24691/m.62047 type:complete len:230 (-) Transcript_24691:1290-1979(-)